MSEKTPIKVEVKRTETDTEPLSPMRRLFRKIAADQQQYEIERALRREKKRAAAAAKGGEG